jgi:ABC-type branched-subunit amino acid transport system ATPase component
LSIDGLHVEGLTVRYGGRVAVDGVTLAAPAARLSGLIGPNGAGKTTLFNACSGLLRPAAGTVTLFGEDITRRGPATRAQRGLGRTFQRMELFDSLTVAENVAIGHESALAGSHLVGQLYGGKAQRAAVAEAAAEAIDLCGLGPIAARRASGLPTGQRRLVELARALAGRFRILLLDEPSSGLDGGETARFGEILCRVVTERGTGILLVEHDMALVMAVCEYIYVLDFGKLIFEGGPTRVRASEVVRSAYLGSEIAV